MADTPEPRRASERHADASAAAAGDPVPLVRGLPAPPKSIGRSAAPVILSTDLLQGGGEVQILHNGDFYRLTVTRAGKLILHK